MNVQNNSVKRYTAKQLFNAMDACDGKDNKISGSIWNELVEQCGAKKITKYIQKENAIKSITVYLSRATEKAINYLGEKFGLLSADEAAPADSDNDVVPSDANFELVKTENGEPYYKDSGKLSQIIDKYTQLFRDAYDKTDNPDENALRQLGSAEQEMINYIKPLLNNKGVFYIESNDVILQIGGKGAMVMESCDLKCCIYPKGAQYDEQLGVYTKNETVTKNDPKLNGLSSYVNKNGEKCYKDNGKYHELRTKFDRMGTVIEKLSSRYCYSPVRAFVPELAEYRQANADLDYYENQIIGGGSDMPNDSICIESGGVLYKFTSVERCIPSNDGHQYSWLGFDGIPVDEMA